MEKKVGKYIYLQDIFRTRSDNNELRYLEGTSDQIRTIKKYIGFNDINVNESSNATTPVVKQDLSGTTLDIKNVIITKRIEELLYTWMREFKLDVVDTTTDPNQKILVTDPETGKLVEREKPITVRNDQLLELKRQINAQQREYDITDFYVLNEKTGKKEFNKQSAQKIVDLIKERQQSGETRKLPLSLKNVFPNDKQSILEISAFLISAINHTELRSTSGITRHYILPTISQLCFDFSVGEKSWIDIKTKFPVGSQLYFSKTASYYTKATVIENYTHNEDGECLFTKESLTEEEREKFINILVEYDSDIPDKAEDDSDVTSSNGKKQFYIKRNYIISREVLIFPTAIFEGGKSIGLPSTEELSKNIENNKIEERSELKYNQRDSLLFDEESDGGLHQDLVPKYRKLMRKIYHERGQEVPKIDLKDIIRGEESPFSGMFIANTDSYSKD